MASSSVPHAVEAAVAPYAALHAHATGVLGVTVAAGLRVADLPVPWGRGVIAACGPVEPGTTLVSVPLSSTLSVRTMDGGLTAIAKALAAAKVLTNEADFLALLLIRERYVAGAASRWAPYLATLPDRIDSPFFFTPDEAELFKGTNFAVWADNLSQQVHHFHALIHRVLTEVGDAHGLPAAAFTPERYAWGLGMVWSRCVTLRVERRENRYLVPLFDMFNHSPTALCSHKYDHKAGAVVIESVQGWAAGEQVFINYGDLPTHDLLKHYGYVVPRPLADESYTFELSAPPGMEAFEARVNVLAAHAHFSPRPTPLMLGELHRRAAAARERGHAAATDAELSAWKASVGNATRDPSDDSLAVRAELFQDVPHTALLRTMRVLQCAPADLPGLERVLRTSPDHGLDIESEALLLKKLAEAMVSLRQRVGPYNEVEVGLAKELEDVQARGHADAAALAASVQAELAAAGKPTVPTRTAVLHTGDDASDIATRAGGGAEAGGDDDDDDDIVVVAGKGRKGRSKGKAAAAGKGASGSGGGKRAKAAATAPPAAALPTPAAASGASSAPTTTGAAAGSDAAASSAPPPAPGPPTISGATYLQRVAAYLRVTERAILDSQIRWILKDLKDLRALAEAHNAANATAVGGEGAAVDVSASGAE